jgi:DmsE family decaheme c-type cytochrome
MTRLLACAVLIAPLVAAQATYIGSDMCLVCHEDVTKAFASNPHHVLASDTKRGPDGGWKGKECEACHGPGSKHAESIDKKDIRNPAALPPAEAERICLSCHLNQPTHAGRIQSSHVRSQIGCTSCHAMHKTPTELVARKPGDVNQLCASCHTGEWAAFSRPYRHRLPEEAMSCVDCHNPHGRNVTSTVRMVASSNEPGCYKCHGEMRGPFVYEHEPLRTDGCVACHEPHGSANPRMLTRDQPRTVCLECHANIGAPSPKTGNTIGSTPPAFHNLQSPRYQTCVICHIKVHGSNVSSAFLR